MGPPLPRRRTRHTKATDKAPPPQPPPPPDTRISLARLPASLPPALHRDYDVVRSSVDDFFGPGKDPNDDPAHSPLLLLALEEAAHVARDAAVWLAANGMLQDKALVDAEIARIAAVLERLRL